MSLLTIGAFARAAGLSPKALRLYDDLGLLPPARVDPASGYRLYDPAQLERARLVAWLRRIGMPLAEIRSVCGLEPARAAEAVSAFWARMEAEADARRDLVAFLVGQLSGKVTSMGDTGTRLAIRYAARSETGLVRDRNEDLTYAGDRLLAVADGFGGPQASAAVIEALRPFDRDLPAGSLLNVMHDAVRQAGDAVREPAGGRTAGAADPPGTTLTAMLLAGSRLALVHIGDSRAYLLRDDELSQITHDHSLVQSMVDDGRISAAEAASHPQRALLLRALAAGDDRKPDTELREARAGDRYLLCSDGLCAVVPAEPIGEVLRRAADPETAAGQLVELALQAGGPDNVSCVVADVFDPSPAPAG